MSALTITVQSFSFKHGYPPGDPEHGGGYVFDVRCLPNPGREPEFAQMSGLDAPVRQWLKGYGQIDSYLHHVKMLLTQSVDSYLDRSFTSLTVSFGCTGGQHRSVYCAELIASHLHRFYRNKLRGTSLTVVVKVRHLCQSNWAAASVAPEKVLN
ncbi:MAG: RapZ C-terminal domain-containing protein [Candidatus Xenobia bacterium]